MSDAATSATGPLPVRARVLVAVLFLLIAGLVVYSAVIRPPAPRRLKLALVTWTQDPFWEPLIHGAQDCAAQSDVELTVIRSEPTVEAENQHIRDLLAGGVDGIA